MHAAKKAEVSHMVPVGDGVWISFKFDSTLRLFHGTTLTCMQDLDIGPSVQRILGECSLYGTVKVHFSAREKIMRIGQNGPLEKFMRIQICATAT